MEHNEPLVKIKKPKNDLSVSTKVNTKAYRDAFEKIPVSRLVMKSIYEQSGRILQVTSGTEFEYMVAINARTGALVVDNLSRPASVKKTGFTFEEMARVNDCSDSVVVIHNHPNGKPPSFRDVCTVAKEAKVTASVVVGHDGGVWYMAVADPGIAKLLESYYNVRKDAYGEYAENKALSDLLEENGTHHLFDWRRLR